jgi:hypothetical protein
MCCSHRFAAGRIRPVCGPVAGHFSWPLFFQTWETAHRAVATKALFVVRVRLAPQLTVLIALVRERE